MATFTDPWDWGRKKLNLGHNKKDHWIPWAGGDSPVEGNIIVYYRHRDGDAGKDYARNLIWGHYNAGWDIVEYRVPV
jgi:hypothetical protein